MIGSHNGRCPARTVLAGVALLACLGAVGCQVEVGGQTLPSPYYLTDDVQYYPPGPEFKLAREAAAMKAHGQELAAPGPQPVQPQPAVPAGQPQPAAGAGAPPVAPPPGNPAALPKAAAPPAGLPLQQ